MTGKAKPKKHTAKEIAMKVDAATTNRGGGAAGKADRLGLEKGGHAKLACPICKTAGPDVKTLQVRCTPLYRWINKYVACRGNGKDQ